MCFLSRFACQEQLLVLMECKLCPCQSQLLRFESITSRRRASFLRPPVPSVPQQLENVLPQKQRESDDLKRTEKKKIFTWMEAGRPYLSTHAIFTAVLIVLVYRLLFHLETQSLSKEQKKEAHSMQGVDHWYLFPPLQLTEDSLEAFVHVVKLKTQTDERGCETKSLMKIIKDRKRLKNEQELT